MTDLPYDLTEADQKRARAAGLCTSLDVFPVCGRPIGQDLREAGVDVCRKHLNALKWLEKLEESDPPLQRRIMLALFLVGEKIASADSASRAKIVGELESIASQ